MNRRLQHVALALLVAWLVTVATSARPAVASQAAGPTVWDGVYTEDQAGKGAEVYRASCIACHGSALEGVESAPPLTGDVFGANWTGTTLGELAERIRVSMPLDKPGSLGRQQLADVIAYILKVGNFPAGMTPLDPQAASLDRIRFISVKP